MFISLEYSHIYILSLGCDTLIESRTEPHTIDSELEEIKNYSMYELALRKKIFKEMQTATIVSIIALLLTLSAFSYYLSENQYSVRLILLFVISLITLVITLTVLIKSVFRIILPSEELKLRLIHVERQNLNHKISMQLASGKSNIFEITASVNNRLEEIYTLNTIQAKNSFNASIIAIATGFITMIVGFWLFYLTNNPNLSLTALSTISGITVELLGASFLRMYKEAKEQLNNSRNDLMKLQNIILAIEIANNINDNEKRENCFETVITSLIPNNNTNLNLYQNITSLNDPQNNRNIKSLEK